MKALKLDQQSVGRWLIRQHADKSRPDPLNQLNPPFKKPSAPSPAKTPSEHRKVCGIPAITGSHADVRKLQNLCRLPINAGIEIPLRKGTLIIGSTYDDRELPSSILHSFDPLASVDSRTKSLTRYEDTGPAEVYAMDRGDCLALTRLAPMHSFLQRFSLISPKMYRDFQRIMTPEKCFKIYIYLGDSGKIILFPSFPPKVDRYLGVSGKNDTILKDIMVGFPSFPSGIIWWRLSSPPPSNFPRRGKGPSHFQPHT